jgi:hypothetical protein
MRDIARELKTSGTYSFAYGQVLVIRGKLPTVPRTHDGEKRMGSGQMREWDMCVLESLAVTATYRCLYDEQIPVGKNRRYTIVVAHDSLRPRNAKKKCGVAWLPADPAGDGAGRTDVGTLASRNVIPSSKFHRSSWQVTRPTRPPGDGPVLPDRDLHEQGPVRAIGLQGLITAVKPQRRAADHRPAAISASLADFPAGCMT